MNVFEKLFGSVTLRNTIHPNNGLPNPIRSNAPITRTLGLSAYNRIANDLALFTFGQATFDDKLLFTGWRDTDFNSCLQKRTNIDQTAFVFKKDLALTVLLQGHAVVVPVEYDSKGDYQSLRVGTVIEWMPKKVRIDLYNDNTGDHDELTLSKEDVAIITNPFYEIMNAFGSIGYKLTQTLNSIDSFDIPTSSGKIDVIVQLPFAFKGEKRMEKARDRMKLLEDQMAQSRYGIGYIDGAEKITQLNRPANNTLIERADRLTEQLFNQLGISMNVFKGTASPSEIQQYKNTAVYTLATCIAEGFNSILTPLHKHDKIIYDDSWATRLTLEDLDKLIQSTSSNEVLSSNEIRTLMGYTKVDDTRASALVNKNIKDNSSLSDSQGGKDEKE